MVEKSTNFSYQILLYNTYCSRIKEKRMCTYFGMWPIPFLILLVTYRTPLYTLFLLTSRIKRTSLPNLGRKDYSQRCIRPQEICNEEKKNHESENKLVKFD